MPSSAASIRFPTVNRLRATLREPLPGLQAQMGMAPDPRPGTDRILDPFLDCRRAGVLALLYPGGSDVGRFDKSPYGNDGELCLVLTRRTDGVDNHRGQISFPGGSMHPDEDAVAAALRETQEELGVDPAQIDVLGQLSPLYIPPSGFCIYPVAGFISERPCFIPSPNEVAEVLEVPLDYLLNPTTRREEVWPIRNADVRVPFYAVGPHKIWGATAMVLCELLTLI